MTPRTRPWNASLAPESAWRGTAAAASINVVGMIVNLKVLAKVPGSSPIPTVVSVSISLALLLILYLRRKTPSTQIATLLYLCNVAAVVGAVVPANQIMAMHPDLWIPFQAQKLACLVAPLVAPAFWPGFAGIVVHGSSAVIQYAFFDDDVRQRIAFGEPWASLVFALAGFATLLYRYSSVGFERRYAEAFAATRAMQQVNDLSFATKDSMNTPLQTLTFAAELLKQSNAVPSELVGRISTSVAQLTEINKRLTEYETEAHARAALHFDQSSPPGWGT